MPASLIEPEQASPYFPNSRLFVDPLYIDVEAVPEFAQLGDAVLAKEIARLRNQDLVDYGGVAAAKLRALGLAYERFRAHGVSERRQAFDRFRQQHVVSLERFACFETLRRKFGTSLVELAGAMAPG